MTGPAAHGFRWSAARELVVEAARSGFLGPLADELGLAPLVDEVFDRPRAVERAIWREAHAVGVSRASPLALDLLAGAGFDADRVSRRIEPNGPWPTWLCGPRPNQAHRFAGRWKGAVAPPRDPRHDRLAFLEGGRVLRRRDNPDGALGVRLSGGSLNAGGRVGPVWIRTEGSLAVVSSAAPMPATVLAACAGRPLEALLDHPAIRGRDYEILGAAAPLRLHAWALLVRTGDVQWTAPWAAGGEVRR